MPPRNDLLPGEVVIRPAYEWPEPEPEDTALPRAKPGQVIARVGGETRTGGLVGGALPPPLPPPASPEIPQGMDAARYARLKEIGGSTATPVPAAAPTAGPSATTPNGLSPERIARLKEIGSGTKTAPAPKAPAKPGGVPVLPPETNVGPPLPPGANVRVPKNVPQLSPAEAKMLDEHRMQVRANAAPPPVQGMEPRKQTKTLNDYAKQQLQEQERYGSAGSRSFYAPVAPPNTPETPEQKVAREKATAAWNSVRGKGMLDPFPDRNKPYDAFQKPDFGKWFWRGVGSFGGLGTTTQAQDQRTNIYTGLMLSKAYGKPFQLSGDPATKRQQSAEIGQLRQQIGPYFENVDLQAQQQLEYRLGQLEEKYGLVGGTWGYNPQFQKERRAVKLDIGHQTVEALKPAQVLAVLKAQGVKLTPTQKQALGSLSAAATAEIFNAPNVMQSFGADVVSLSLATGVGGLISPAAGKVSSAVSEAVGGGLKGKLAAGATGGALTTAPFMGTQAAVSEKIAHPETPWQDVFAHGAEAFAMGVPIGMAFGMLHGGLDYGLERGQQRQVEVQRRQFGEAAQQAPQVGHVTAAPAPVEPAAGAPVMERRAPARVAGRARKPVTTPKAPTPAVPAQALEAATPAPAGGLLEQAARFVVGGGHPSSAALQRQFKIGYTEATGLIDQLEARGILGPLGESGPRAVLGRPEDVDRIFAKPPAPAGRGVGPAVGPEPEPLPQRTATAETPPAEPTKVPAPVELKPPTERQRSPRVAPTNEAELADAIRTHFPDVSDTEAKTTAILTRTVAEQWAKRTGKPVEEFYKTQLGAIRSGVAPGEGALPQEQGKAPTFYSQLERTIGKMPGKQATTQQVRAALEKGGVKADEMKWTGFDEFLAEREKAGKPVTKAEAEAFLRENRVDVQEVMAGATEDTSRLKTAYDAAHDEWLAAKDAFEKAAGRGGYGTAPPAQRAPQEYAAERAARTKMDAALTELDRARAETKPARYGQYALPGGENYRELLLTLPESPGRVSAKAAQDRFHEEMRSKYGRNIQEMTMAERRQEYALQEAVRANPARPEYRSSHWDEPNVLAHVRFDERVDAEGKRVIHVAEIQSDLHQTGRKQGYALSPQEKQRLNALTRESPKTDAERAELDQLIERGRIGLGGGGVPSAPFSKTWHDLALKRIVRWASEHGYDRVTWDVGATQVDRYDLSKRITHSLAYNEKKGVLSGYSWGKRRGQYTEVDKVFEQNGVTPQKLEDYVGKEVAERILASAPNRLGNRKIPSSGLRVGGEGMKGFYDKILPASAAKLGKKWGAKVGETEVHTGTGHGASYEVVDRSGGIASVHNTRAEADRIAQQMREDLNRSDIRVREKKGKPDTQSAHYLDITPAMRESALTEGQPLFQGKKGAVEFLADGRAIIYALEKPDVSTVVHELGHVFRRTLPDEDMRIVEAWAGVKNGEWQPVHEEKFARAFERYLRDGKAPTEKLREVFAQFKEWLTRIYERVLGSEIDVHITPEVRKVFDRMLGGGEQENLPKFKPVARETAEAPRKPATPTEAPAPAAVRPEAEKPAAAAPARPSEATAAEAKPPKTTTPNPSPKATGLANQVSEREVIRGVIRAPEKGIPESAASLQERGRKLVEAGEDYEALARRIATKEQGLTEDAVGVMLEGKRLLLNDAEIKRKELDRVLESKGDATAAQVAYEAAQQRLQNFLDDAAKGNTSWHNIGMALQAGTNLDTGNFEAVLQESLRKKGSTLTKAERAELKALSGKVAALEARNAELEKVIETEVPKRTRAGKGVRPDQERIQVIHSEREKIIGEIREIAKTFGGRGVNPKTGPGMKAGAGINPAGVAYDSGRFLKAAGKLLLNHLEEKALNFKEASRAVIAEFARHGIDVTEDQIAADVADLSKGRPRTRTEIQQRLDEARAEAREIVRLNKEIADLEQGTFPKEGTRSAREVSERLQSLRARKKELLAGYRAPLRENASIQRLNEQIAALQRGELPPGTTRSRAVSEKVKALQRQRNDLRQQQFVKDQIRSLQRQLDTGDYEIRTPAEVKASEELQNLRAERDFFDRKVKARIKSMQPKPVWQAVAENVTGTLRGTELGSDAGVVTRQGLFTLASHPIISARSLGVGAKALWSEQNLAKWQYALDHERINGRLAALAEKEAGLSVTDALTSHEELVFPRLVKMVLGKVPKFGEGLAERAGGLERFQTAFINNARREMFRAEMRRGLKPWELKARAEFINNVTGRANLKPNSPLTSTLAQLFATSPRYEWSRWAILAEPIRNPIIIAKDLYSGKGLNRGAVANLFDLAKTAGGVLAVMKLAELAGYQVNFDPTAVATDFLRMRKGDDVWDVTAGIAPRIRDVARIIVTMQHPTMQKNPGSVAWGAFKRTWNPGWKSPLEQASIAMQKRGGEAHPRLPFEGFKAEDERQGLIALGPLIYQAANEAYQKEVPGHKREAAASAWAREFWGSSVNRYPEPKPFLEKSSSGSSGGYAGYGGY